MPKSFTELLLTFEPTSCGIVAAEAYLEVSGRDNRLPLSIKGYGLGPCIEVNPHSLDVDYIYLSSSHKYEV